MTPLVSVLVTAYNQRPYVSEALLSVLAQETAFPVEILVGVDRSDDGTDEIVREIEHANPGRLRVFYRPERLGLIENFRRLYGEARGELRALLEGDDYWTEPAKLERQLRLLEKSRDAILCGHRVEQVSGEGEPLGPIPERPYGERPSAAEFAERLCDFHTSSLVFRDPFAGELPAAVVDPRVGLFDLPLKLALAARGGIAYLPEPMSVFRRVAGSASSSIDDEGWRDLIVRVLANVDSLLTPELRRITRRQRLELLVGGALSGRRSRSQKLRFAMRALVFQPRRAIAGLVRGSYSELPEETKQLYRRARGALRGGDGGSTKQNQP
jgi:glycosyltransferase involved in cell wall biosynthesis